MPDQSPAISVFISLLIAVGGLYLLRIPQAARMMANSWARLTRAQEEKIDAQAEEIQSLINKHEECERRADDLERRLRRLEQNRR